MKDRLIPGGLGKGRPAESVKQLMKDSDGGRFSPGTVNKNTNRNFFAGNGKLQRFYKKVEQKDDNNEKKYVAH
jgi:hypothetical protein